MRVALKPWYEWIALVTRAGIYKLSDQGNPRAALEAAEIKVGVRFPRRYREFMSAWNGGAAKEARFFKVEELKKPAEFAADEAYEKLPPNWLPIATQAHGMELYCLDGDAVVQFDPETGPQSALRWPDLEAFLLDVALGHAQNDSYQRLLKLAAAHGVDVDALPEQRAYSSWLTWEQCREKVPHLGGSETST